MIETAGWGSGCIYFLQLVAAESSGVGGRRGTQDRDENFRLTRRVCIRRRSRGKVWAASGLVSMQVGCLVRISTRIRVDDGRMKG